MNALEVLIAGGGIGGVAAAVATARAGNQVRVYERAPVFSEVGAGVQLGPNATRVLIQWGLTDALKAVASFPALLQVRSAESGAELGRLELGPRLMVRYGAPYASIHRADLHHLLTRAMLQQEGVHLCLDQAVAGFQQDEDAVALQTSLGVRVEGDVLVGADGVWSHVRAALLDDGVAKPTGHLAYRAMLKTEALPPSLRENRVTAWLGPRLHVVQYPVRGGEWTNVVAIVHGAVPDNLEDWDHSGYAADLLRAMGPICAMLRALLEAAPTATVNSYAWRLWPLAGRPPVDNAEQMARGRVALLGDAAHPMVPFLAQGAGMAIEDAAELARALSMDAVDVPTRLQRYALARWQRVARVQARAWRNGQIFHSTGLMRLGRDASMKLMGERLLDVPWLYSG
ncbi:MAG: FAD-dependent monooxygenase [Ottowia sp.]|nr:FAD-dependent monooxygenase [Ottowia sp.]